MGRWYHHTGTITDIIKIGRQVKKILNLIFEKVFEPSDTLIEERFFFVIISAADQKITFYKNPCDIYLEHVFLTKFGLWRAPVPKSHQISFRFFGYHKVARIVVTLN